MKATDTAEVDTKCCYPLAAMQQVQNDNKLEDQPPTVTPCCSVDTASKAACDVKPPVLQYKKDHSINILHSSITIGTQGSDHQQSAI